MRSRTSSILAVACGLAVVALAGCEAKKSENPLSPSVAGPIPGVDITPPAVITPANNTKFRDIEQPIRLTIQNAATTGVRPLSYAFDVGTDSGFASKVFSRSGVAPGTDGKTSVQLDLLDIGRVYYWRVRAEDGANTGPYTVASFEIYPKPSINPPVPVSPVNNALVASATPTLTVQNASWAGPVGGLSYEFQVAADQAFTQLASAGVTLEGAGSTTFATVPLAASKTMYWRARAGDGTTTSGWSATQSFRTPAAVAPPPPTSPPPAGGGTCTSSNPQTIVECERAKYGHMDPNQTVSFLTSVAVSLQRNGIGGGPFGLLHKGGGSNCNGYSCDIICAGQGTSQKQWDVLGDAEGAQTPAWNGPNTYPNIRVDVCDIKQ